MYCNRTQFAPAQTQHLPPTTSEPEWEDESANIKTGCWAKMSFSVARDLSHKQPKSTIGAN